MNDIHILAGQTENQNVSKSFPVKIPMEIVLIPLKEKPLSCGNKTICQYCCINAENILHYDELEYYIYVIGPYVFFINIKVYTKN